MTDITTTPSDATPSDATPGACAGWSVLELGSGSIAGSLLGMVLADNGARVLKVEAPAGDPLRRTDPSGFLVWNRGKESVTADLRTKAGQAAVRDEALRADVLIAPFPDERLAGWNLDVDSLRRANPLLVACSITGFGNGNAYSRIRAYEGVVAAKAGLFGRGAYGFRPGPIFYDAPWASLGAAHMATAGVLGALIVRERTGKGQRLDVTLAHGLTALDYFGTIGYQLAQRSGDSSTLSTGDPSAPSASRTMLWHATSDGRYLTTTAMVPRELRALVRAVGVEEAFDAEPRFARAPVFASAQDAQDYEDMMWPPFRQRPLAEWIERLFAEPDVAFEAAATSEEALDHPQIVHNGESIGVEDPERGLVRMIGPVARLEASPARITRVAPALGEHEGPLAGPAPVQANAPMPAHLLAGVTVVECGYFFAMPFGVSQAASLGARVIKIEGADGDPMRTAFGTPETTAVRVMEGKESLSIDLATPQGREIMHRILARADVFVTSFRTGVPEKLGLGYDELHALNPALVYVHATGYGSSGPYSTRAMYATAAQTAVGATVRSAGVWLDPDFITGWEAPEIQAVIKPHLTSAPTDGDSNAALAVLSAIMLGLTHQRRTGEGQLVRTSMLGGNALCYSDDFCTYAGKPVRPRPDAESTGLHALYRLYEVSDGWVFLAAPTDAEWIRLSAAIDRADLTTDARFTTAAARLAHDTELVEEIGKTLFPHPASDLEQRLVAADVACVVASEAGNSAFTSTDAVMRESGQTVEVEHPIFGRIVRQGLPAALSDTPGEVKPSALRGDSTDRILRDHGYTDTEIAALHAGKIVFGPDEPRFVR